MIHDIRKPTPKNNVTKTAATVIVLASPGELDELKIASKNAVKKKGNAIKKKMLFPRADGTYLEVEGELVMA